MAGQLVRRSYGGSRVVSTVRSDSARIDLRGSIFCAVRQPVGYPLCGYYAAAFTKLLTLFDLESTAAVVGCRGTGEASCVLMIPLSHGQAKGKVA